MIDKSNNKTVSVKVNLLPKEKEQITHLAEAAGMSVSAYVRQIIRKHLED